MIILTIVLIAATITPILAQDENAMPEYISLTEDDISEIIITDVQDLKSEGIYGTRYQLLKEGKKYMLFRTDQFYKLNPEIFKNIDLENSDKRKLIHEISADKVRDILNAINDTMTGLEIDRFPSVADRTINWETDIKPLLQENNNYNQEEQALCLDYIKDAELYKEILPQYYSQYWDFDNPEIVLDIVTVQSDTIKISTEEQEQYMLPWEMNGGYKSYNPSVSVAIAAILPELEYSNVGRLSGEYFEEDILMVIYDKYCKPAIGQMKLKKQYLEHFRQLEKEFEIIRFEKSTKAQRDIEGEYLAIDMKTTDPLLTWNTRFSLKGEDIFPAEPIISVKKQILENISKSWISQFLSDGKNIKAEIAFADSMSFSKRAQALFITDAPTFMSFDTQLFDGATLLTITENSDKTSTWIILPDGRTILWYYKGAGVLTFGDQQLRAKAAPGKSNYKIVGKLITETGIK